TPKYVRTFNVMQSEKGAVTSQKGTIMNIKNFINNQFVDAVDGSTIENYNPSQGEVYSTCPASKIEDVNNAVDAAKKAFSLWSQTSAQERADFLRAIGHELSIRANEFAEAESLDQGKTIKLARSVDIPRAIKNFEFFSSSVLSKSEDCSSIDGKAINYTLRKPLGVAGLISPWNLPLYLLTWKIAPAIAFGNTAVCKPSELTPLTAFMLAEVVKKVGLPEGVINMVFGYGADAGRALVKHPDVPLISFTGGTATAETIIKDSAPYFKKLGLELGGKNPNIIFEDCNFEKAVETSLLSSFNNQGEICLCGSRMFVHEKIYDRFMSEFIKRTESLVVGDPKDENSFMGALVSAGHRDKVMGFIEEARKEGSKILTGGEKVVVKGCEKGYFIRPTVIETTSMDCKIMQEEVFGPVVTVTKFSSEEEVLQYANSTRYGLSASLWTQDVSRAHRMADKIDSGTVWVNSWMIRDLRVPFGGMKASGIGREGGEHSIDFYTEAKNVCVTFG
ncbi:MAG: aldehyde dehydrogenase, partial [Bdellovibrionales bacterium]|nr:aldehyde dehydrogenase [Bdellovibrionales bacterium]